MFFSYIPDKNRSHRYAGIVSSGCCSKSDAEILSTTRRIMSVCKFQNDVSAPQQDLCLKCPLLSVFDLTPECAFVFRISCKDLKSMLSQVNYRVPNMRFLREKLPVTFFFLRSTDLPCISHFLCLPLVHAALVKACDLSFLSEGFRAEERRRVVQPVRPALSQPHVRRSEKCKSLYKWRWAGRGAFNPHHPI